jgi:Fe2+ or Zn2+ uptake regulation protein
MKQRALELFKKSALIHTSNITNCFYLCLTLSELGKIEHAKQIMNDCMEIADFKACSDHHCMILLCLMMIHSL